MENKSYEFFSTKAFFAAEKYNKVNALGSFNQLEVCFFVADVRLMIIITLFFSSVAVYLLLIKDQQCAYGFLSFSAIFLMSLLSTNKSIKINSYIKSFFDSNSYLQADDPCAQWFGQMKAKSGVENHRLQPEYKGYRYLQCVMLYCTFWSAEPSRFKKRDVVTLVRNENNLKCKTAIEVFLLDGTMVGCVFEFCSTIPAGLLDIGMHIIARIFAYQYIGENLCMVLDLYIDDQIVCRG